MNTPARDHQRTEDLSKKRKPDRRRGESDPYRNSHDSMPGENTIRRLFEIVYICPLCQGVHETHQYVTLPADNLDDFRATAVRRIREPEVANHIVTTDSELRHLERGDLRELTQAMAGQLVISGILKAEMTSESIYTCDECGQRFDTIAQHRDHMGVDAITGKPTKKGRGIPACHAGQETA